MNGLALAQLLAATATFIAAAALAKTWALAPSLLKLAATLGLYTAGNLLMLRLVRHLGMATAFSLSAAAQLLAVNVMAVLVFGERIGLVQGAGLTLAVVAVLLLTLAPSGS